jgi:hypothetical protein
MDLVINQHARFPIKKECPENVCLSGKCPEYCNILDIFQTFDPNPYVRNIAIFRIYNFRPS